MRFNSFYSKYRAMLQGLYRVDMNRGASAKLGLRRIIRISGRLETRDAEKFGSGLGERPAARSIIFSRLAYADRLKMSIDSGLPG
jgi:hypothetical protein